MSDITNMPAQASQQPRSAKSPSLLQSIRDDVACVRRRDPAARGELETLLIYPGVHALIWHRIAHHLWRANFRFGARLLPELTAHLTPLRRWEALDLEAALADELRRAGVTWVAGGH